MKLLVLTSLFVLAVGSIEKRPMPKILCDCFSNSHFNATTDDPRKKHFECIQFYLTRTYKERWYVNQTESGTNFINSLEREMVGHLAKKRRRRTASRVLHGVREEVRTASKEKRDIFFDAIQKLKADTSVSPNQYEALASIHTGAALGAAHGGWGFLPWHRYYLLMFEVACRRKNGRFVMLYWDSSQDDGPDAFNSRIWDNEYLGSRSGAVQRGPFAGWTFNGGMQIIREFTGEVIRKSEVNDILKEDRNVKVMGPIEASHNEVHAAMQGTMLDTETAPQDPAFWLHHCYIDCLWEWFRDGQVPVIGAEYEYDYPATDDPLHKPYSPFGGRLRELSNINGLQSVFTDFIYKCDKRLTCPGTCENQKNFRCTRNNECVARPRQNRNNRETERFGQWPGNDVLGGLIKRKKRDVHFTEDDDDDDDNARASFIDETYQNSYYLDGRADIKLWAFIPVRLLCYFENKHNVGSMSDSGSGATKVIVQSDGISYSGKYLDYGIVDARLKMSETIAYVGVKHPRLGPSKAYISAFDMHGMVCRPRCLNKSSKPVKYTECSGVIEVTTEKPKMYGDTVNDAVMYRYTLGGDTIYPECRYLDIYLTFVCEYSDESPWSRCQN